MKPRNIIIACGAVAAFALLTFSCVKEKGKIVAMETTNLTGQSFVQVFNATVGSTRNYVYVDGKAVTGAAIAFGGNFPLTPANFSIVAGYRIFLIKDTLGSSTQPPMSFGEDLQAGRNYTIFMYDTSNAAKQKTVVNNVIIPSDTTARLRFANFAYSSLGITAVDVFSKRLNMNIFTNVATTDVTNYIPYDSRRSDTLYLRPTGTTTNILNNMNTVASPNYQPMQLIIAPVRLRSYTVVFRGSYRNDLNSSASSRNMVLYASN